MNPGWLVVAALAAVLLWIVASYNRFVEQRNLIRDSWATVETELQRRYDLIPALVETVKGYAQHEQTVLAEVTEARSRAVANHGRPDEQARDENELVTALRHLFAVVEDYPELAASDHFLELQRELTNTEDRIQAARRFYNANVRSYNQRVQQFPSQLVAGAFDFSEDGYFEVAPALRSAGAPGASL